MNAQQANTSELERATQAIKENRWTDAITDLQTAHERAPDNCDIWGQLGFALSRNEQYAEATRVLEELSGKEPTSAKWPYMVAYQHYQQKAWARAIEWFDKALKLRPGYVKVLYRKGYAHLALGQEQEGIEALISCISSWTKMTGAAQEAERPSYGKTHFQLGKIYLKKGRAFKARGHLQIAAQIDSKDHDVLEKLATAPPPEVLPTVAVQDTPKDNEGIIESYKRVTGIRFYHQQNAASNFLSCLFCGRASKTMPRSASQIWVGNHTEGAASCACRACKTASGDSKPTWSLVRFSQTASKGELSTSGRRLSSMNQKSFDWRLTNRPGSAEASPRTPEFRSSRSPEVHRRSPSESAQEFRQVLPKEPASAAIMFRRGSVRPLSTSTIVFLARRCGRRDR